MYQVVAITTVKALPQGLMMQVQHPKTAKASGASQPPPMPTVYQRRLLAVNCKGVRGFCTVLICYGVVGLNFQALVFNYPPAIRIISPCC